MPTYPTPTPIDLAINVQVGSIQIIASDRVVTVVTVEPTSINRAVDRRGADDTTIDFDGQRMTITGPRPRLSWIGPGPTDSVDITVDVPTGSRLTAELALGMVRSLGRLGATRIKSSSGAAEVDVTGDLWMRAGHGNATVGTANGSVEIIADHGQIRIGTVTGDALLKSSHGSILVSESGADLDAKLSYGDLAITKVLGSVTAKTAYGSIQLDEVSTGSIAVESGFGQVTIGVKPGVPAWLDLSTKSGHVRNELVGDAAPAAGVPTVSVRARTQFGDITIQRAR